jgi:hypothetical protein
MKDNEFEELGRKHQDNKVTLIGSGIKCDHCTYRDDSVLSSDYINWLNKPCPECGENLLTEADFNSFLVLEQAVKMVNEMPELNNINIDIEAFKNTPFLKDAEGLENLNDDDTLKTFTLDLHNGIRVSKIEKK